MQCNLQHCTSAVVLRYRDCIDAINAAVALLLCTLCSKTWLGEQNLRVIRYIAIIDLLRITVAASA